MTTVYFDPQEFCDTLAASIPIAIYFGELSANDLQLSAQDGYGYRIAEISANSQCFGGCNLRFYDFLVAYRGANFNIVPPVIDEYKVSVYDAISSLQDRELIYSDDGGFDSCPPITEWELTNIIEVLPNGWSTGTLLRYHNMQYNLREFKRVSWAVATSLPYDTIPIHPTLNRPLSNGETQFINFDTSLDWLGQQIDLFLANHWGDQDWESKYHVQTKQWIGCNTAGKYCKQFDINQYHPMFCYPHDAVLTPSYMKADFFGANRLPRPRIEELQ